eukprot:CAMPEP_0119329630 /NCGR_PEP_ID=MMETSP1333-20130426/76297_1 /TAXON_ID=418940 /ORGANISM="Scyphosphaera apsteinii, Strain RCC1455" /LENGTH=817 /DNA_ID=CAMNT_0007338797 /DNA_START=59 /DNA_END=2512 /DNA_ORIENTATION=+
MRLSGAEFERAFDRHRMASALMVHKAAILLTFAWLFSFAVLYCSELQLTGTLWPTVYKIKLTIYLSTAIIHLIQWWTLDESEALYVFGSLGSLHVDSLHPFISLFVVITLSFDDHRLVRLLDLSESYATQMAKSYALNPNRQVPICGGYTAGGHCFFNNLEAAHMVIILGHMVGMGFGLSMCPKSFWRLMHFTCAWYALVVCTLGHMFSSTLLMLQTITFLYGSLSIIYITLKRQHTLLRCELELKLETQASSEMYRRDNETLKQLAVCKDNFVASLSHEMRTPLNGILGMLQLLTKSDNLEQMKCITDKALAAGELLKALLDDTLNVTRLEQGRIQLDIGRMSLPKWSHDCVELMRPSAETKGVDLQLAVDADISTGGECMADSRRMSQVLLNLIQNSVKFTPEGGKVHVQLQRRSVASSISRPATILPFLLSVSDSGIGIQESDLAMIFLKYTKATDARGALGVDRQAGAGLGLSICKAIVELHGGQITVESQHGKGSTFSVNLDLPLAMDVPSAASGLKEKGEIASTPSIHEVEVADALHGCHVLVADDVEMNRFVAAEMLQQLGCIIVLADNGAAAVDAICQHRERGQPFDAVLMDVQMPILNGLEAATEIRKLEGEGEHVPIIALTGFAGEEERTRCLQHMDDYMTKPLLLATAASKLHLHIYGHKRATNCKLRRKRLETSATPGAAQSVLPVDLSVFDPHEMLQSVGNSRSIMHTVLRKFNGEMWMKELDAALAAADASKLRITAHAIKGSLGYLRARAASKAAEELEHAAVTAIALETTWERLAQLVARLRDQVKRVEANRLALLTEHSD